MKYLILFFTLLIQISSFACSSPPASQSTPPEELIERTSRIVLAKVTSAKVMKDSYNILYKFKKIKTIKGKVSRKFTIKGHPLHGGNLRNFNNHNDEIFWSNSGWGRVTNDIDCRIHPSFSVGGSYLLFLDKPYHEKGFERIIRIHSDSKYRDKWLNFVEEKVALPTS